MSSDDFTVGNPQTNKISVSRIQGTHARRSAAFSPGGPAASCLRIAFATGARAAATCEMSALLCLGVQNFSSTTSAMMDESDATMSTSIGPTKFETRNCETANATPATSAAGQI